MLIEYRVREITRYIVTRYETSGPDDEGKGSGSVTTVGEYANADMAYEVGYAVCKAEHDRLGFPIDDARIQYPRHPNAEDAVAA
jgi:hypothetical protein